MSNRARVDRKYSVLIIIVHFIISVPMVITNLVEQHLAWLEYLYIIQRSHWSNTEANYYSNFFCSSLFPFHNAPM